MPSKVPVPAASPSPLSVPVAPKESALEAFLDRHFRTVVYVCVGLIAASAIYGIMRYRSHQSSKEAAEAATAAKTTDDCDIVIQKYKGTTAAGNASLTKAKLLWEQNKKDQAVTTLRDFVANDTGHPFYVQGLLSLATRLESLGGNDAKEAQTLYEKIVSEHKTSEVAGLAQLRIADILWNSGKEAEAKKIYDELPRQFIGQYPDMVEERLKWLGSALPTKEVDGPKPPPDSIKAPTPNGAPPINLKSGINGASLPFEIKPGPAAKLPENATPPVPAPVVTPPVPAAEMKLTPPPAPTLKVEPAPATPAPAPKIEPATPPAASSPPVTVPAAPAPTPAPAAPAPAAPAPVPTAPAPVPTPAPAEPAK